MESDLQHHHLLDHQHKKQISSSLTRYQSAPSSYLSNSMDKEFCEFLNRPPSPETERIFARFLSSTSAVTNTDNTSSDHNFNSPVKETVTEVVKQQNQNQNQNQIMGSMKDEKAVMQQQQQSNYSSASQSYYQSQSQNLVGVDRLPQMNRNNSNLIRHSSSPAGLFANINIDSGYPVMRGMGNFGAGNNTKREASFSSASKLPPSSRPMSPIAEVGNKSMEISSPNSGGFGENRSNDYSTGFPIGSWDDSIMMSDNITGVKRLRDEDRTLSGLNASDTKDGEGANRPPLLAHQLSLPNTSAEMSAIEKFLQFSDSVPCKIRAKRGCATHPRSIAERVRRTRISERMRKLQELVPNMDKQTNTADMLDLAVDYIKDLQRQFKTLSEIRAKCTCSNKQQR